MSARDFLTSNGAGPLVPMARATGAPNQPPKAPARPCGVCGWYVGAHQLTTSTYLSNQPIVPSNPPCDSHRAAGERPLSQGSPCLLLIKVTVKERKRHQRGGREAPVWRDLEDSADVNREQGRQTIWPREHLLHLKPRPRKGKGPPPPTPESHSR